MSEEVISAQDWVERMLPGGWARLTDRERSDLVTVFATMVEGVHKPVNKTELGWTRRVCFTCGSDWPCAVYAQAREAAVADEPVDRIAIRIARGIRPDSWVATDPRFADFKAGYEYAQTQTMAIQALSLVDPEDLYYAWNAINRGIAKAGSPVMPTDPVDPRIEVLHEWGYRADLSPLLAALDAADSRLAELRERLTRAERVGVSWRIHAGAAEGRASANLWRAKAAEKALSQVHEGIRSAVLGPVPASPEEAAPPPWTPLPGEPARTAEPALVEHEITEIYGGLHCSCGQWERTDGCRVCLRRWANDHLGIPNVGDHP